MPLHINIFSSTLRPPPTLFSGLGRTTTSHRRTRLLCGSLKPPCTTKVLLWLAWNVNLPPLIMKNLRVHSPEPPLPSSSVSWGQLKLKTKPTGIYGGNTTK